MSNVVMFEPSEDGSSVSKLQLKRKYMEKDEDHIKEVKIRIIPEECIFNKEVVPYFD